MSALERDYTHLTVISHQNRALLGYLSIPKLQSLLNDGKVTPADRVEDAMTRFRRKGTTYQVITKDTPLIELEAFFNGTATEGGGQDSADVRTPQEFAIVTDPSRRFVLGVATKADLEEFVRRRPA